MSEDNNFTLSQLKTIPNMLSVSRLLLIPALAIPSFFMTDESVKKLYPDGPPEIVNVDHDVLPPKTLQLGLYLLYLTTQVTKEEDEDEIEFERRKDWHDWFNGYVNQEAIQRPLFHIEEVFEELDNKQEIVQNHIRNFFDSLRI